MKNTMLGYAMKEIYKKRDKYFLNILLIALISFMLITLNSLGIAYKNASKLPFKKIHSSIIIQKNGNVPENTTGVLTSCSLAPIRKNLIQEIKNIDGVNEVSDGLFLWVFDKDNFKRVLGVNWNDTLGTKIKASLIEGNIPRKKTDVLVDKTYSEQYNISIGQKINISGQEFRVSGIGDNSGKNIISSDLFLDLEDAQKLAYTSVNLQKTEKFERSDINIIFVGAGQTKINEVSNKLNILLNSKNTNNGKTPTGKTVGTYTIYTPTSFEEQISSLFKLSDKLILFISLITVIGSILIIIKSISHTIMQRKKEFGIMKSVGFTNKNIQEQIMQETMIQVLIGYLLGITASFLSIILLARTKISISIPWELNPYPHFLVANPSLLKTVQTYSLPIKFQPIYALMSFAIVVLVGIFTTWIITRNINKLKASEVLKNE